MNLQLKKVTSVLLLGILVLSLAPAIIAYIPEQTAKFGTDYVILEGTFVECCTDSVQYSYKVNTWATETLPDYCSDLQASATQGSENCCWDPDSVFYNASKVLRIAMTEYGEFAANNTENTLHTGIAYGADADEWEDTESWATTAISEGQWVQGWLLWVNYTYWLGPDQFPRALLAWAEYSDGLHPEQGRDVYNWDARYNSSDTPENDLIRGYLTTSGVKVLYDSARLAVIRASVLVHDSYLDEDFAKITFTVIFDKCGKVATVFKDVKMLFGKGVIIDDFAFSERYELDLAAEINPTLAAYIHYFDWKELQTENLGVSSYFHPVTGTNSYDVLQAYDKLRRYVFAAAYWPNATEFDVFTGLVPSITGGKTTVLPDGHRQADFLGAPEPNEPWVPFVSVQWRYNRTFYPNICNYLSTPGPDREMRFVEVLTMTDFNDDAPHHAMDYNDTHWSPTVMNRLDAEVAFQVDYEIMRPEDLNTANHDWWIHGNEAPEPYCASEDLGPFMYTVVGVDANVVDDLAAAYLSSNYAGYEFASMPILDKDSPLLGTIPYALDEVTGACGEGDPCGYLKEYNSVTLGIGSDPMTYYYVSMKHFAFDIYDGIYDGEDYWIPQPIKGGFSRDEIQIINPQENSTFTYFYPSINPLGERWVWCDYVKAWFYNWWDVVDYDTNGMITVGGPKANWVTRYFNDYMYAITREGAQTPYQYYAWVQTGQPLGTAPTSNPAKGSLDFFPLSTWNTSATTFGYKAGYAVIALGRDESGLRGLAVYGWDARDTYWASEWAAKFVTGESCKNYEFPDGTMAIILHITYQGEDLEPSGFEVIHFLGTITEFGDNEYIDNSYLWDHPTNPGAGTAGEQWYGQSLGHWAGPCYNGDEWWFKKFPTCDESRIQFDS